MSNNSSGSELLATVLIILCLFLLWCWWKRPRRCGANRAGYIGSRPSVVGRQAILANLPDLAFKNLNETIDRGNYRVRHPMALEGQDLVAMKWVPEGMTNGKSVELGVNGHAVTDSESLYEVRTRELGPDIVMPYRPPFNTRRNSHSMDGLLNSTLQPSHGNAWGLLTN